jgi:hypothetical protein
MKKFQEFTELEEALIILGKKAYPKFGHIVIMAGGAGSGKGFVKDKLLGIEGWPYDVDDLKKLAMKSPMIQKAVKKEFGVELEKMNLKNPDDVSKLHEILKFHLNIDDKKTKALYTGILTKAPDRKPNIIFDVTRLPLNKTPSVNVQLMQVFLSTPTVACPQRCTISLKWVKDCPNIWMVISYSHSIKLV